MRYAIFFVPDPKTEIARLGARWLGRDVETGAHFAAPVAQGLGAAMHEKLVARPRRYGFHATLQAPFRLAEGYEEKDLLAAFRGFARSAEPIRVPVLSLNLHRGFFALVPAVAHGSLTALAGEALRRFAPLRAVLTPEEATRRRAGGLTPRQEQHLERHGYPYVLDQFRFHMTLTGPVADGAAERVESVLHGMFAQAIGQPLVIDRVALLTEPQDGADFRVVATAALGNPLAYANRVVRIDSLPREKVGFYRR